MKNTSILIVSLLSLLMVMSECTDNNTGTKTSSKYNINFSVKPNGSGNVMPNSGKFKEDMKVNFTAEANKGFKFDKWTGDYEGNNPSGYVTVNADKNITAHFVRKKSKNIVQFVQSKDNLSDLTTSIQLADLMNTLQGNGPFTVFAPNDDAFKVFLEGKKLKDIPKNKLKEVLQYHVVKGDSLKRADLSNDQKLTTVQGNKLTIKKTDGHIMLTDQAGNTAKISSADNSLTNGIVHVIDGVLNPMQPISIKPMGSGTKNNPYKISSIDNLVWISNDQARWDRGIYYKQTEDIDASGTNNPNFNNGKGFSPIGVTGISDFLGSYDGQDHIIKDLMINQTSDHDAGLFGYIDDGAIVKKLGLVNVNIKNTGQRTGGLAGRNANATISECYVTGTVKGSDRVGGLAGEMDGNNGVIKNSYSTANIITINENGPSEAGLVGAIFQNPTIIHSYSSGQVTGGKGGGLVGTGKPMVKDSYWDITSSEQSSSAGGTGLAMDKMKQKSSFKNWDFDTIWHIDADSSYPYLQDNEQIPHPGK